MSNKNGKALSEVDILRADNLQLRQALAKGTAAIRTMEEEYALCNRVLATLMHSRGDARVELTQDQAQDAFLATWHRLDIDTKDSDEEHPEPYVVCALVPVTAQELKKARKAAAKKAKKGKGPKLLGPDGNPMGGGDG